MRLTKYSHSCVRFEGDGVLVIDPGGFSERAALDGVDAVLITHEHADHLDLDALTEALAGRPAVRIFTPAEVLPKLGDLGSVTTAVGAGDDFTAAGFGVRAYGGRPAGIRPDRVPSGSVTAPGGHAGCAVGIDLGSSNTVAILRWADGRTRPLLFDGRPVLPSAVYVAADGAIHAGSDAERMAQLDPASYEPNPKRRIDDG